MADSLELESVLKHRIDADHANDAISAWLTKQLASVESSIRELQSTQRDLSLPRPIISAQTEVTKRRSILTTPFRINPITEEDVDQYHSVELELDSLIEPLRVSIPEIANLRRNNRDRLFWKRPSSFERLRARLIATEGARAQVGYAVESLEVLKVSLKLVGALQKAHLAETRGLRHEVESTKGRLAYYEALHDSSSRSTSPEESHPIKRQDKLRLTITVGDVDRRVYPPIFQRDPFRDSSPNKARHDYFYKQWLRGTCSWFINSPEFWDQWLFGNSMTPQVFYCWGPPGAGKSVTTSHVIQTIKDTGNMCAYYYLGEGHVQSAEELVFELLGQLCDLKYDSSAQDLGDTKRYHITNVVRPPKVDEVATPPIAGPILDSISSINSNDSSHHPGNTRAIIESFPTEGVASGEHDSNLTELTAESIPNRGEITDDQIKFRGQTGEPLSTLLHALSDICSTISPPVFIVLDALDDANMERPCDFLSVIRTLLSSNCRVFLTGRERPDIKPVLLAWPHTQLEIRHPRTVNDIQEYVKHLLDTPQDSHRHIRGYSYSIPDLTEIIANLSDAVFPFAYAYATGSNSALTRLLGRQVQGGKTSGFRTSPLPLREAIAQTLSAIDVLDPNEFPQSLILLLLLNSPVPISISALGEALPIILKLFSASHELNASYYDFPAVSKPIWPLITVDPGNELIHLSSQVVIENLRSVWLREWTKKCPELLPQNFTKQLAIFCLQYQLDCNLEAVDFEAESNVGKLLHQNPCLAFAVTSWDTYYRKFQQSTIQFSLGSHTPSSSNTSTRPSSSETRLPVPPTVIDFPPLLVPAISMEVSSARYLGVYEDSSDHVDQFRPSVDGGFDRTIQGSEEQRKRLINEDEEEIMQLIGRLISRKDLLQAMVLLPIYLNKDPSAAMLTWHETLSWTSSFRELHAISKLGLVNAAHKSGLKMTQSDVNAKDERGLTALHIAAQIGIQEDICVLLEAGAMPHTPDYSSRTPMDYAADGHHDAAMAYLFESFCEIWSSANSSLLNIRNIAERYGLYLKAGRETDTSYLSIALLYATKRSKVEVVRCLLNSGADPNCWDENGTPVLHHALSLTSEKVSVENSFLIIDLLLMNGGDPSIISNNDIAEPALHVAARSGNSLAVFTMIRVGADTRSYDAEGRTALMVLIQATEDQEYAEAMTLRLSLAGVDIERADKKGRRALHIAAQKDFPSVASELVWGCRAEVAPRDNEGRTPLDYARENGSTETVELLERIR